MIYRRGAENAEQKQGLFNRRLAQINADGDLRDVVFCLSGDDDKQKHGTRNDPIFVTFVLFVVTNCLTTKDAKYTKEEIQGRHR